jgi:hypothetical protein
MFEDPFFTVVVIAIFVVLAILMIGLGGFAGGGNFNKRHSNRLMRYRIIAQAIAVVLILAFIWISGGRG